MTDRSVVAALLRKSHQRLDAARILCTEGHYEDSINRAYYAMYSQLLLSCTEKVLRSGLMPG